MREQFHLSVVSHGQGQMVRLLLEDLKVAAKEANIVVTITLNFEENLSFDPDLFPFPIRVVTNSRHKGFGANHNAAFDKFQKDSAYFCVVNPDIRIHEPIFKKLLDCLEREMKPGVVAPLVKNQSGIIEDSARRLPTPWNIFIKAMGFEKPGYRNVSECTNVDWVAGMFMLFPREVYMNLGGFNDRYFLYYEDVDLCCRLHLAGYKVLLSPKAVIEHDAQRTSHRQFRYFKWHFRSISRFFLSSTFLRRWYQIQRAKRDSQ